MATELFPVPSHQVSVLSPIHLPGHSPKSSLALRNVLRDNHEKWHTFFNDDGFHNHISHHVLALWSLGADAELIQAAYERDMKIQRPAYPSPEAITSENFNDHLGDENYFNAYLAFFTDVMKRKNMDIASILEEYVFSSKANFGSRSALGERPEMLNRFLDAIIHPMIHTGYGAEFKLPGMVIEGLAQTAVHCPRNSPLIPPTIFPNDPVPSVGKLTSRIHKVTFSRSTSGDTHAFTILARILKDPELVVGVEHEDEMYSFVMKEHGEKIYQYAKEWTLDTSDPSDVERKIEELQWMNVMIYALPGFKEGRGKDFNADFFLMHLVTSSLFLPSLSAYISPASKEAFLRSYFAVSLFYWISRGRPALEIEPFFSEDTTRDDLGGGSAPKLTLVPSSPTMNANPNPWLSIIQHTILHPDDHLAKCQRALAHYANLYGSRPAGWFTGTELPGADKLDGTLFLRAATLTDERLGRERDEEKLSYWDRHGFFKKV